MESMGSPPFGERGTEVELYISRETVSRSPRQQQADADKRGLLDAATDRHADAAELEGRDDNEGEPDEIEDGHHLGAELRGVHNGFSLPAVGSQSSVGVRRIEPTGIAPRACSAYSGATFDCDFRRSPGGRLVPNFGEPGAR